MPTKNPYIRQDAIMYIIEALEEVLYDLIEESTEDYETRRQLHMFMLKIEDLPLDSDISEEGSLIRLRMIRDAIGVSGYSTTEDIGTRSNLPFLVTADRAGVDSL